jgi:linoleoyl-CoA desaturase
MANAGSYASPLTADGGASETWTVVDGVEYDVGPFLRSHTHPGGNTLLAMSCGRDASQLVRSYHALASMDRVRLVLGSLPQPQRRQSEGKPAPPSTAETEDCPLYSALRQRVAECEGAVAWWVHEALTLLTVAEFVLSVAGLMYGRYWMLFADSLSARLCMAVLQAVCTARLGFLMHMAGHGAIARIRGTRRSTRGVLQWRQAVNSAVLLGCDLLGASGSVWQFTHQISHHLHTNHAELDNDLLQGNALRLHPQQPKVSASSPWPLRLVRRHQHLVLQLAFSLSLLKWAFVNDIRYVLQRRVKTVELRPLASWDWPLLIASKGSVLLYTFVLLPWMHGWSSLPLILAFHAMAGHLLYQQFIINHLLPGAQQTEAELAGQSWAEKQVRGSVNWRSGCLLACVLSGGLNHQVEHHLFPTLHPYLLPKVAPIVRATCREYGVPYHDYATFSSIWMTQRAYVNGLGREGLEEEAVNACDLTHCPCASCNSASKQL